jgi:hypothetical protein
VPATSAHAAAVSWARLSVDAQTTDRRAVRAHAAKPGGQRGALLVDEEDRPGRGVHGHPADVVSERLGHASATITLTV